MSPRDLLRELPAAFLTLIVLWTGLVLFVAALTP